MAPSTKVLRILVFPVKNRTWAFQVTPPASCQGSAAAGLTWRGLWKSLTTAGSAKERVEIIDEWGTQKAQAQWTALEKAPPKSIKGRIAKWGDALMRRAHPGEQFLKSIPRDAQEVEVLFPADINHMLLRRRVRLLARRGDELHRRWTYLSAAALPFSLVLSILPTPNVVLFYNLFRAHAHWHAWRGGDSLLKALSHITPSESQWEMPGAVRALPEAPPIRATASIPAGSSKKPEPSSQRLDASKTDRNKSAAPTLCLNVNLKAHEVDESASSNADPSIQADTELESIRYGTITFVPSRELAQMARSVVDSRGIPLLTTLDDEQIARLAQKYGVDQPLILKWRDTGT